MKMMHLRGARTNNLKNIDVDIPLKKFTIVTGVSGSGKSSLVFDTLYAEGQRRYVESLSTYTRQFLEKMAKPDIDSLENVSPAIALEQKNHINNNRSTVATMSEIYDYLRLLFSKVGTTFCTDCGRVVKKETPQTIAEEITHDGSGTRYYILSPLGEVILTKTEWQPTRQSLIAQGFERVLIQNKKDFEVQDLSALEKLPAKCEGVFLIIDRLVRPEKLKNDSRLMDALDQAFHHGVGSCTVAIPPGEKWVLRPYSDRFRCDHCNKDYRTPEPQLLSFNSPLGACDHCSGFGYTLELSENIIVPDPKRTIKGGAIDPFTKPASQWAQAELLKFCAKKSIPINKRYVELSEEQRKLIWDGEGTKKGFAGIRGFFEELKEYRYKMYVRIFIRRYQEQRVCTVCEGTRLKLETRAIKIGGLDITQVLAQSIEEAVQWFQNLKFTGAQKTIAQDVLTQIQGRLQFLENVGVGYLTLNRLGKTLSGGECQRINLASQLGNKLCSTLYVLDEPSIGLHPADTDRLITLLKQLRDHGNTVVVVEHDLEVIGAADYLIELGPQAGYKGGSVVAQGDLIDIRKDPQCLTAKYLTGAQSIPHRDKLRPLTKEVLKITGANENNLQDVTVEFPLHQLVVVTGLSGSGKTTLVHRILYNALNRVFHQSHEPVGKFQRIYGVDYLKDVVLLDQKPIGKSPRSNPATYLKLYDDIRKIYANQSLSLRRGYDAKHFSFNVKGGRCPVCEGEGEVTIDMHFMAEVKIPCEECNGKRFKKNILEVEFKRKNIYELLTTTIDECIDLFREYQSVSLKLQILKKVGLGYLQLGQSATTLSGGESQRLKVASVLTERAATNMLYIFDEPTTGLHVDDVKRLLSVLHDLVDSGNSVILIEHNLDVIAQADHIIDLGPGGGKHGGQIVALGTPKAVMAHTASLTGQFLNRYFV